MQTGVAGSSAFNAETNSTVLRRVLLLDAIASGGFALLGLVAADWLSSYLGLSPALLRGAGIVLIPFVALLLTAALRENVSAPLVGVIVALNVLWVVASIGVAVIGNELLPGLGVAFVLVQAAAVALFAWLQYVGAKRIAGVAPTG